MQTPCSEGNASIVAFQSLQSPQILDGLQSVADMHKLEAGSAALSSRQHYCGRAEDVKLAII